jgi:sugar lactone lactonase YvrE
MDAQITEITDGLRFPEGPVWMPDGTLLCTELLGGCCCRLEMGQDRRVWAVGEVRPEVDIEPSFEGESRGFSLPASWYTDPAIADLERPG